MPDPTTDSPSEKPECQTPKCLENFAKGYWANDRAVMVRHVDVPTCQYCGGKWIGGQWVHRCSKCKAVVEPGQLVGLFVPHLCGACLEKALAADRAAGRICRMCHVERTMCCC